MPELRIADEPGDQLAVAAHHRRDEHADLAVVGRRRREQLRAAASTTASRRRGPAAPGPARSCARSRRRTASPRRDSRSRRRPRPPRRPSRRRARRARERRTARSAFDSASERVGTAPATAAYPTDRVHHDRGRGGLLRHAVVLGRPPRGDAVVRGAWPHRLRVRAEGRPEAPRSMARAIRRRRARGLPFPRRWRRGAHRLRDLPGLSLGRTISGRPRRARREARAAARARHHAHRPVPRRPAARSFAIRSRPRARRMPTWPRGCTTASAATCSSPSCRRSTSAPSRRLTSTHSLGCSRQRSRSAGPARSVVNDEITVDDACCPSEALGGRPPLLWDNVPVNDAVMADRLFMGPLRGRGIRASRALLRLPREPDGATTGLDASARLDRGMVRRRGRGTRLA